MKMAMSYFMKIVSVMIVMAFFISSFCINTIAETGYKLNNIHNMKLQCDGNSVYVTGYYGNTIMAGFIIYNGYDQREFQALGNVKYVSVNNDNIYALSDYNDNVVLSKYIYSEDTLLSYNFGNIKINSEYKFCVSNDRVYLAENNISNTFSCYNIYGERQYSFKTVDMIDYFTTSNNNIYLVSHSKIYEMETNFNAEPSLILTTDSLRPNIYMSDGVVADYGGYIVDVLSNTSVFTGILGNDINCAYANGYYCRYSSGNIYGYSSIGNKSVLYRTGLGGKVQMCGFKDNIYLLSEYGELSVINKNELNYPQLNPTSSPQNSSPSINHDNDIYDDNNNSYNNNSEKVNNQAEKHFSINNYYIDEDKKILWNIPQGTTIASLKNNITYEGYSIEFYNSENVRKTSGKVGTGFYFTVLDGGNECHRYTLSVLGDLTGEGSVNRNDVKLLCKYLDKCTSITDGQYVASDVNNDGVINGVDILKIAKNNL